MWLLRGLAPDFKTIADFRKDNPSAIGNLFKEFVAFLKSLSLYGPKQVAVDGTKLLAVNSSYKAFTKKALAKRIKVMEKSVTRYLEELDERTNRKQLMTNKLKLTFLKRLRLLK